MEQSTPPLPEVKDQPIQLAAVISVDAQGIQIVIPIKVVQETFQTHMDAILSARDRYDNPIKKVVEGIFSTYGDYKNDELRKEFANMIATTMKSYMATPGFHLQLGQAMAEEMAKEAVRKLNVK